LSSTDEISGRRRAAAADRLDVLGLNRTGRLVVVELRRDRVPHTVTMQAINYAAMVRRFSLDTLAEVHAAHLGGSTTAEQALVQLTEWAESISDETLNPPRIVLMAGDFGPTVTNTALFLYEAGIDIRLIRYQLYETSSGEKILAVAQLLPVPDAEDFMVRPPLQRPQRRLPPAPQASAERPPSSGPSPPRAPRRHRADHRSARPRRPRPRRHPSLA
jgi:hypothetical protein